MRAQIWLLALAISLQLSLRNDDAFAHPQCLQQVSKLIVDVRRPFQLPQISKTFAGTEVSVTTTGPYEEGVNNTDEQKSQPGPGPLLCECECECSTESLLIELAPHEPGTRPCCCRSCGPPGGRGCNIKMNLVGQGFDLILRGIDAEDEREPFDCQDCREVNHLMHRRKAVKRAREKREAAYTGYMRARLSECKDQP